MNYNLFVDESCHLEHDRIPVMCIGYIKAPHLAYEELRKRLTELKKEFKTPAELKWNKFSHSRLPLYKALVDFFSDAPIEFRCVLVKYKEQLNHEQFNLGSHDNFYYKMTYFLLRPNPPEIGYNVFLDIKDTRGKEKLKKIEEVFKRRHHGGSPFVRFQHLRSRDNVFFQLTDLFIGAVTYRTRQFCGEKLHHEGKAEFINYLESKSGFLLHEGTSPRETKFNILTNALKMIEHEFV